MLKNIEEEENTENSNNDIIQDNIVKNKIKKSESFEVIDQNLKIDTGDNRLDKENSNIKNCIENEDNSKCDDENIEDNRNSTDSKIEKNILENNKENSDDNSYIDDGKSKENSIKNNENFEQNSGNNSKENKNNEKFEQTSGNKSNDNFEKTSWNNSKENSIRSNENFEQSGNDSKENSINSNENFEQTLGNNSKENSFKNNENFEQTGNNSKENSIKSNEKFEQTSGNNNIDNNNNINIFEEENNSNKYNIKGDLKFYYNNSKLGNNIQNNKVSNLNVSCLNKTVINQNPVKNNEIKVEYSSSNTFSDEEFQENNIEDNNHKKNDSNNHSTGNEFDKSYYKDNILIEEVKKTSEFDNEFINLGSDLDNSINEDISVFYNRKKDQDQENSRNYNKSKLIKVEKVIFKEYKGIINKYAIYEISFLYDNKDIRILKRYSDFNFLKKYLQLFYPYEIIPALPKKNILKNLLKDCELYEKRSIEFKFFLNKLFNNKYLINNAEIIYDFLLDDKKKINYYKKKYMIHSKKINFIQNIKVKINNYLDPKIIEKFYTKEMKEAYEFLILNFNKFNKFYLSTDIYLTNLLKFDDNFKFIFYSIEKQTSEKYENYNKLQLNDLKNKILIISELNFLFRSLFQAFKNYDNFHIKSNTFNKAYNYKDNPGLYDINMFIEDINKEIPDKIKDEINNINLIINDFLLNFNLEKYFESQLKLFKKF